MTKKTNKDLLVICPTKERPQICERMIKSFDKNSSSFAKLFFFIDHDDKYFNEYINLFDSTGHKFCIRGLKSLCEMYNHIVKTLNTFQFYSETNDDFVYHTKDWDRILINKLKEKKGGIAYGDDRYGGSNLPTTSIISGEIIQAVGWIHMPTLDYLCNDVIWREIGHRLNRLYYMPEVKIEHMHPLAGKAEKDDTFKRTNSEKSYTRGHKAFREWKALQMNNDIQKIKEALK